MEIKAHSLATFAVNAATFPTNTELINEAYLNC